jgi:hypothetical protein
MVDMSSSLTLHRSPSAYGPASSSAHMWLLAVLGVVFLYGGLFFEFAR